LQIKALVNDIITVIINGVTSFLSARKHHAILRGTVDAEAPWANTKAIGIGIEAASADSLRPPTLGWTIAIVGRDAIKALRAGLLGACASAKTTIDVIQAVIGGSPTIAVINAGSADGVDLGEAQERTVGSCIAHRSAN